LIIFSQNCEKKPVFRIDHFKVYKIDSLAAIIPIHVDLKDQFAKTSAGVSSPEYFANPVSKNGQRIIDSTAHLAWHKLVDDTPVESRAIRVINQFGKFRWKLGKAVYLLVPTHKIEKGSQFPEKLDHFKCYEILAGEELQRKVILEDQFDRKLNRKEKVVVEKPLFFAVPVSKNGGEIFNKSDHLACYHIAPNPTPTDSMKVSFENQFGKGTLTTRESYMLCVPSKKYVLKEGK
ncbi:MAG: hypothetical protein JSW07_10720, partial [bacterium]